MTLRHALLTTAILAAAPAEAAQYVITYTGTVYSSYDQTGEFGAANSSLDGLAFKAVYTLTAPLPGAYTSDDGTTAQIFGGTGSGSPSPVSGSITINGNSVNFEGDYYGVAYQSNGNVGSGGSDTIEHSAEDYISDGERYRFHYVYNYITSGVNDIVATQDYTQPLNYTIQAGDYSSSNFYFYDYSYVTNTYDHYVYGNFTTDHVTIALAGAAVPEPAAWALLIAGFGLTGGAMRRRQARIAFA